ncbi:MAG: Gfo/Idh/MocA family oxidoreductase, partial [Atopobiaceae bacterium]|nr:Gfo/Idh/MocA family oxidoreductase [Atopobiaceae bacterium]
MAKIKVGIIGCGGIANSKHLPALQKNEDLCEVVAFCDIVEERAKKAAEDFGTAGAKVYTDYHELLSDPSIDVVHVCTPNVAHSEITIAAFEAAKDVYCEKPMSNSPVEAQKMVDAWKKSGKQFTIGYQNRFRPEVQNLHASCVAGDLGDIYYAKAHAVRRRGVPTWGVFMDKAQQGGGPLIDIGTHALDITLWCMGNYDIDSVTGSVFYKLGGLQQATEGNRFGPWDPKTYEVEDSAMGFIKMKNGATIGLEASWALNILESR